VNLRPAPAPAQSRTPSLTERSIDLTLAACGVLAAVLVLANPGGPIAAIFIVVAWLFVPGWACARALEVTSPAARALVALIAGAAISAILSLLMVWTTLWFPQFVAVVALAGASGYLAYAARIPPVAGPRVDVPDSPRHPGIRAWIPVSIGLVALVLWIFGLMSIDISTLGRWGLLTAFPFAWYLAVAAMVGLCIWGITARRAFPAWGMGVAQAILIAMLYASANILESAPRLPWIYKHIAVASFIDAFGRVDPSIDIYNRWPGFFATSAFLGRIAGYRNPISYATWAELVFPLIDAALVFGIARAFSKYVRFAWTATLVFSLCNWVNQNYYSPQAFAFTLHLGVYLAVVTLLRATPRPRIMAMQASIMAFQARIGPRFHRSLQGRQGPATLDEDPGPDARPWSLREERRRRRTRIAAITAILILQVIITASHQLTPYFVALGLLPLSIFGYIRPRWLGPALLAIPVVYLIPNLAFVQATYGLFSGFNFLANATFAPSGAIQPTDATKFGSAAAFTLSALTLLLASAGWLRNLRWGNIETTVIVAWLALAPAMALLGQSYGGEGRLRVFLFGLPWYSIGIAWLFWSRPAATRKMMLGFTGALTAMAVLFTIWYFQPEAHHMVPREEVSAATWLDARVVRGDLAVDAGGEFPFLIGANYWLFNAATKWTSLAPLLKGDSVTVSPDGIEKYLKGVAEAPHTYVVFYDNQDEYVSASALAAAEAEIRSDPRFRTVYENPRVRIYELL
jgi:hypothetical protein